MTHSEFSIGRGDLEILGADRRARARVVDNIQPDFNGMTPEAFLQGHRILEDTLKLGPEARLRLLGDLFRGVTYEVLADRSSPEVVKEVVDDVRVCLGALDRHHTTITAIPKDPEAWDDPDSR